MEKEGGRYTLVTQFWETVFDPSKVWVFRLSHHSCRRSSPVCLMEQFLFVCLSGKIKTCWMVVVLHSPLTCRGPLNAGSAIQYIGAVNYSCIMLIQMVIVMLMFSAVAISPFYIPFPSPGVLSYLQEPIVSLACPHSSRFVSRPLNSHPQPSTCPRTE